MAQRRRVLPPSRRARHKQEESEGSGYPAWAVISGNTSVISREYHDLQPTKSGSVTEYHIMTGNVPVVSLALWKKRDLDSAEGESESLPGDWTARVDPRTQRTYYYSRSMKKTQWVKPTSASGSTRKLAAEEEKFQDVDGGPWDWVAKVDPGSSRTYYYSASRRKTQWGKPAKVKAGLDTKDDWVEKVDPRSGRTYFFSPSRNVTSWTRPDGSKVGASASSAPKESSSSAPKEPVELNEHGLPGDWKPQKDRTSGRVYYSSKSLNKTSWTKPEGSGSRPAATAAAAPQAAAPPTAPSAGASAAADLLGFGGLSLGGDAAAAPAAAAPAPDAAAEAPPVPAAGRSKVLVTAPSFRDPTDPGFIPDEAPPDPDAPPELDDVEDEVATTEFDHEGYLMKKGGGKRLFGRKNWNKRYFVLVDSCLAYFKTMEGYESGEQPIKGAWISVSKYTLKDTGDLTFELTPKKGEDVERNRGFQMKALDEDSKEMWVEKIREAADYDLRMQEQQGFSTFTTVEEGDEDDYSDPDTE